MSLYQILYELRSKNKDYTPLYAAIKKTGEWQHPMETVWYIKTNASLNELYNNLIGTIDIKTDKLIISSVNIINTSGRASTEFWKWIKENI